MKNTRMDKWLVTFACFLVSGCVVLGLNSFVFNVVFIGKKLGVVDTLWVLKKEKLNK